MVLFFFALRIDCRQGFVWWLIHVCVSVRASTHRCLPPSTYALFVSEAVTFGNSMLFTGNRKSSLSNFFWRVKANVFGDFVCCCTMITYCIIMYVMHSVVRYVVSGFFFRDLY